MSQSHIETYLNDLSRKLSTGITSEHSFRGLLEKLITDMDPRMDVVNEPTAIECGAPDLKVLLRQKKGHSGIGYIEAKDVGKNLNQELRTSQLKRYLEAIHNLILTDYLTFKWIVDGEQRAEVVIASYDPARNAIKLDKTKFLELENLFKAFFSQSPIEIATAQDLAKRMALITRMIRDSIVNVIDRGQASGTLTSWRTALANALIPDLDSKEKAGEFADMFAQTLAYGLFSAKVEDKTPKDFSLDEAKNLIPDSNPFLQNFFYEITSPKLKQEPFAGYVNDLVDLLMHTRMDRILEDFGRRSKRKDPVLHFYETFLATYAPDIRELRGVYYTPDEVVKFIVEAVDALLKDKFSCADGLADTGKTMYKVEVQDKDGKTFENRQTHKVLVLDPACGTGTFLYHVIDHIRELFSSRQQAGMWPGYVKEHLLPRIFGFELLMAPYVVAHFKLEMQLAAKDMPSLFRKNWACQTSGGQRLGVFLTNTLERLKEIQQPLGPSKLLSDESNAAAEIKNDLPIMVVMGNPPYSGHSANKNWEIEVVNGKKKKVPSLIGTLLQDYYQVEGKPLGEKNPKWLQNDYVKFIRFGQWRIEQTGGGILAFITDNGYLENPTFRGMREKLLNCFSEIYLLDLHGNQRKKEKTPGGEQDKNVFDIQQGVAIGIFVKEPGKTGPATVYHSGLYDPSQKNKCARLGNLTLNTAAWEIIAPESPDFLFKPENKSLEKEYNQGMKITEAFPVNSVGIVTARDGLTIHFTENKLLETAQEFLRLPVEEARTKFNLGPDAKDWKIEWAKSDLKNYGVEKDKIRKILYRPFDNRFTFYTGKSGGFFCRPRSDVMQHMLGTANLALCSTRSIEVSEGFQHVFCTDALVQHHSVSLKEVNYIFPLYLITKQDNNSLGLVFNSTQNRTANIAASFSSLVQDRLKLKTLSEGRGDITATAGPEDIFHYIYALLYSSGYRERYAPFLKKDYPRIFVCSDKELFRQLAYFGAELTLLHLLKSPIPASGRISFPVVRPGVGAAVDKSCPAYLAPGEPEPGSGRVFSFGRVYINSADTSTGCGAQYFEPVPKEVWEYKIGGYQVCEKWLKDRRGRVLSYDEQDTYCRIIYSIKRTLELVSEIDSAISAHGGWPLK